MTPDGMVISCCLAQVIQLDDGGEAYHSRAQSYVLFLEFPR